MEGGPAFCTDLTLKGVPMRATLPWLGVLLGVAFLAPSAHAQCYVPYIPKAPDACGPGHYGPNWNGLYYGPNYCLFPPFPPYQGELLGPAGCPAGNPGAPAGPGGACLPGIPGFGGPVTFPTHPFARGPRDYFMY
jgi:hypothetical protein